MFRLLCNGAALTTGCSAFTLYRVAAEFLESGQIG